MNNRGPRLEPCGISDISVFEKFSTVISTFEITSE
jgi:hypothetical protein